MSADAFPFDDTQDFDDTERGFIAKATTRQVTAADGRVVWDLDAYRFLDEPAADTAHPSLWRQGQLLIRDGLFEVVPGIYQLRGFDLSVMSVIEGETGVIVIDPLISKETAAAAWALYQEHRGPRTVVAMIYTHSHIDHFGGVKGVIDEADVDAGRIAVIAPQGFMEEAVAENVFVGTAMGRRSDFMYGAALPKGPDAQIGCGLGQTTSTGEPTLIPPTIDITATGQELTIDGVRIVFQVTPGTEAPAEMNFYFPDHKALCTAENTSHTLAQHRHAARRPGTRRPAVGGVPHRDDRPVGRRPRGRLRLSPLAHVGPRACRRVPGDAARHVRLPPRPDAALDKPGTRRRGDRRDARNAAEAGRSSGTRTGTTDRSATTSKPSTSATSVGTTATRRISGRTLRSPQPNGTSRRWEALKQPSLSPRQHSTKAICVGRSRCSTTSCSPTNTMALHERCRRRHSNGSRSAPRTVRGATCSSSAPRSCVTANLPPPRTVEPRSARRTVGGADAVEHRDPYRRAQGVGRAPGAVVRDHRPRRDLRLRAPQRRRQPPANVRARSRAARRCRSHDAR
jgi:glyoxylase-like metal-dependent hydrolase (beta-lactamase superfamily II)